ncbi:MAG: hypothetical protein U9Q97_10340, partial [Acidobacteriota bacterium]|nr:hypothetical protein [Acidobacteriota bacterium]
TMKMTFDDYLKKIKKTEQELNQDLRKDVERRIKRILILKEIQDKENIQATKEEIKKQVDIFKTNIPKGQEKQEIDDKSLFDYFQERLEQEKTLQFLESLILTSKIIKP